MRHRLDWVAHVAPYRSLSHIGNFVSWIKLEVNSSSLRLMTDADFKRRLKEELPTLVQQDPEVRQLLQNALSSYFADRAETESRFDRVLAELRYDREQQAIKWAANERRWDEQDRKVG